MNQYQQFIHKSRYARWLPEEGRRERWDETVNRYVDFWKERGQINEKTALQLFNAIHNLDVMRSEERRVGKECRARGGERR